MNGTAGARSITRKKLIDVYLYWTFGLDKRVNSRLFEIACVLVRLNHIARFIVKFFYSCNLLGVFAQWPPYLQERGLLFQISQVPPDVQC